MKLKTIILCYEHIKKTIDNTEDLPINIKYKLLMVLSQLQPSVDAYFQARESLVLSYRKDTNQTTIDNAEDIQKINCELDKLLQEEVKVEITTIPYKDIINLNIPTESLIYILPALNGEEN